MPLELTARCRAATLWVERATDMRAAPGALTVTRTIPGGSAMGESTTLQTTVVRTDRGLSIGGRRVTLYDVMDYLLGGWTTEQARDVLRLSEQEMADVMVYI